MISFSQELLNQDTITQSSCQTYVDPNDKPFALSSEDGGSDEEEDQEEPVFLLPLPDPLISYSESYFTAKLTETAPEIAR